MSDATRIRAMEARLAADRIEEHARTWDGLTALAELDPDLDDEHREVLALLAAVTTPGESPEEYRVRQIREQERKDAEARAVMRRAYGEHLTSPGCDCGQALGRWLFCALAREEGFR